MIRVLCCGINVGQPLLEVRRKAGTSSSGTPFASAQCNLETMTMGSQEWLPDTNDFQDTFRAQF
jgi:hypothetical protein